MSEPTGPQPGPPTGPPPGPPTGPPPGPPPYPPPPYQPPPGFGPPLPPPAPPPRSRAWLVITLALVLAAVVVAAALVVPRLVGDEDDGDRAGDRAGQGGSSDESGAAAEANLADVQVFTPEPSHDNGDLDYPQAPPVGGAHNDVWLDCGVYDEPLPEENVVHDLEHGTVWITYESGLDGDQVDELAAALPQNGILSPYDDLRAPVVVTVWGRQLDLTGADDPRLELFIEEFAEGVTAPEPFASCSGGATLEQLEDLGLDA